MKIHFLMFLAGFIFSLPVWAQENYTSRICVSHEGLKMKYLGSPMFTDKFEIYNEEQGFSAWSSDRDVFARAGHSAVEVTYLVVHEEKEAASIHESRCFQTKAFNLDFHIRIESMDFYARLALGLRNGDELHFKCREIQEQVKEVCLE